MKYLFLLLLTGCAKVVETPPQEEVYIQLEFVNSDGTIEKSQIVKL